MSNALLSTCTSAYVKLLSGFSMCQAALTGGTRLIFTGRGGAERQRRLLGSTQEEEPAAVTERDIEVLQKGIAELYDESSGLWENIWGEHMHHGFYDPDSTVSLSDHRAAQIRMIEESLSFASVSEDPTKIPRSIVDVGCGIGGSSRYLARKYGAQCQGITLSPVQAQRAQALAAAQGLSDKML